MASVLLTGSSGLIGSALRPCLESAGWRVVGCDLRAQAEEERFDLRDESRIRQAVKECSGIIHLGALSRVVWGQQYPKLCRSINVGGARVVMRAAAEAAHKPWLLFAGSREVYGTPATLPCRADNPLRPENIYAKTKLKAEKMAMELRQCGNHSAVLRFSNVFGRTDDYHDRVVPAFARAAAFGGDLEVRGPDGVYDFTVLDDVVVAVLRAVDALAGGIGDLPPIDIVTGRAVSLGDLAQMAISAGGGRIVTKPPTGYYPKRFQGDPHPAKKYLGWRAQRVLEDAMRRLVGDFRQTKNEHENIKSHSWVSALV